MSLVAFAFMWLYRLSHEHLQGVEWFMCSVLANTIESHKASTAT
jgi:hypothetical protein